MNVCIWVYMGVNGCQRVPMGIYEGLWVSGCLSVFMGVYWRLYYRSP